MEQKTTDLSLVPVGPATVAAETQVVELAGRQQLLLDRRPEESVIRLVSSEKQVVLSIHVTAAGPVLRFEGANLTIQAKGDLMLEAGRLALHGREGLALSCGGDAAIRVERDLVIAARSQTIRAELGDVSIRANDDVKLDGERVRMNS